MPIEPIYTTREVAKHFKRSPQTIRRWVKEGYLRPIMGEKGRFSETEVSRRAKSLESVNAF